MLKNKAYLWILLIAGILVAIGFYYWWISPLGPRLTLPTLIATRNTIPSIATIVVTPVVDSGPAIISAQSTSLPESETIALSPNPTNQPLCGGPPVMTILTIGEDYRGSSYLYGLADFIRVVRVDFANAKVMAVDFPRDLWVEIPGIEDHYGVTNGKLNEAYLFGNRGMGYYDGADEGPGLLANTLYQNFGIRVDHYLAVSMDAFVRAIDAIGGIDVILEQPVDLNGPIGVPDPKLRLGVGTHHMNGEFALMLARNRQPTTFQRMRNQNVVLAALQDKLLRPAMFPKLPGLITRFISATQTDLSPSELNSLLCIIQKMDQKNLEWVSFPEEMFSGAHIYDAYRKVNTFVYLADFKQIRAMLIDFENGKWP